MKQWFKHAEAMWLKDKILIVVNVQCLSTAEAPWQTAPGNHWVLDVVDLKHETFRYYDPLGAHNRERIHNEQMMQCVANVTMWLQSEHDMPWLASHAQSADPEFAPVQGNTFDCGVFSTLAAACEALGIPLGTMPWGQQHATRIRTQLAVLILT